MLGRNVVITTFRFGYTAGLTEAVLMQASMSGKYRETACLFGYLAAKDFVRAPTSEQADVLTATCKNRHLDETYQGRVFAKNRLVVAATAAKYASVDTGAAEIDLKVQLYELGYHFGFLHNWESIDHVQTMRSDFYRACKNSVDAQTSLRPAQIETALGKCDEEAQSAADNSGHGLQCLMAASKYSHRHYDLACLKSGAVRVQP